MMMKHEKFFGKSQKTAKKGKKQPFFKEKQGFFSIFENAFLNFNFGGKNRKIT
jgi:hypothetical protein